MTGQREINAVLAGLLDDNASKPSASNASSETLMRGPQTLDSAISQNVSEVAWVSEMRMHEIKAA